MYTGICTTKGKEYGHNTGGRSVGRSVRELQKAAEVEVREDTNTTQWWVMCSQAQRVREESKHEGIGLRRSAVKGVWKINIYI